MDLNALTHASRRNEFLIAAAIALAVGVLIPVYRLQNLSWLQAVAASIIFVSSCVVFGWMAWRSLMRRRARSFSGGLISHMLTALAFSLSWTLLFSGAVYLILRPEWMSLFLRGGAVWQFV